MSACVLQQQTVLTVFQGSSECLLGILSRIQAEKGLSISKLPMNPSLCAARAWSRTDPKRCRPYKRQVLIDVSASQLCSDISFSTTLCNIRPQCYRTRSDCSSGSPRTIKISRNLEINLNIQWKKITFYRYIVTLVAKGLKELADYANTSVVPLSCRCTFWRWHPASLHHELIMVGKYCFSMFSKKDKHELLIVSGEQYFLIYNGVIWK